MSIEKGERLHHAPPNSYVLGRSLEYFHIPRNVMGIVLGKSTLARCGLIVNCTPLEPEWNGHITIEISNSTLLPGVFDGLWPGVGGFTKDKF